MELIANQYEITWQEWVEAVDKQPIDNSLKFKDIITNTIITAKNV